MKEWVLRIISFLLVVFVIAGPYIVIRELTNFEKGQSTKAQRVWLMCWLVAGQAFNGIAPSHMGAFNRVCQPLLISFLVCPAAVGGFVVVAKMMMADMVCTRI